MHMLRGEEPTGSTTPGDEVEQARSIESMIICKPLVLQRFDSTASESGAVHRFVRRFRMTIAI